MKTYDPDPKDDHFYLKLEDNPRDYCVDLFLTDADGEVMALLATISSLGITLQEGAHGKVNHYIIDRKFEAVNFDDKGRIQLLDY